MGKRADNAKATRAKLLATADRLIGEGGYEGVSVDSIVKASGIAKGTFYNYFKAKEDLIFALSKQRFAHVTNLDVTTQSDAVESISRYLVDFMTVIANSGIGLTRQWVRYVSASEANAEKWRLDVESLNNLLVRLMRSGCLNRSTPSHTLAKELITQLYGIILSWCIAPMDVDPIVVTQKYCQSRLPLLLAPYLDRE
ncbi:TetR/AcrR family transcriptional regulator [Lacticaseibacillus suihuaensis]